MPRTAIARLAALLLVIAFGACGDARTEAEIARDAAAPHVTDSMYRLARRQLVVRNPAALQYAMDCEVARIFDSVGESEGSRRIEAMRDTVYSSRDGADLRRVDALLGGRDYEVFPSPCDTLDRIVLRTDSLPEPRPGE